MRKNRQREQIERERELYEDFLQLPINSTWLKPACLFVIQTFGPPTKKRSARGKIQEMRKEYAQKIAKMILNHYPPSRHALLGKEILYAIALAFPNDPMGKEAKTFLKEIHHIIM